MFPVDTIKTRMQALAHPGQQARPALLTAAVSSYCVSSDYQQLLAANTPVHSWHVFPQ